jgi:hypothetical protein
VLLATLSALTGLALCVLARYYVGAVGVRETDWAIRAQAHQGEAEERAEAHSLSVARALYLAGMLTVAQTTVRPLMGFTLSDWLFFAALCAALAGLIVRRTPIAVRVPWPIVLGVALFVVSGLLSSVGAVEPLQSVARVARFGYLTLVWFWLGTVVLTNWRTLRAAVGLWVVSVALDGVAAILQARGVQVPYVGPVMWGRMTGFTENVNDLGGAAGIALAPALALAFTARNSRTRVLWCLALAGVVAGVVLSGSVGGMAAGAGAVVMWLVVSSHGLRPVLLVVAALVLALGVTQVQGALGLPTPLERLMAATGQSDGGQYSTITARVQGYDTAWVGLAGGGWVGVGLDAVSADVGPGVEVHDLFLNAWYEAGWLAAVGMVLVVAAAVGYALAASRRAFPGRDKLLAIGILSAVAAFIAMAMGAPILHQRYAWVAVALAIACSALVRESRPSSRRRR